MRNNFLSKFDQTEPGIYCDECGKWTRTEDLGIHTKDEAICETCTEAKCAVVDVVFTAAINDVLGVEERYEHPCGCLPTPAELRPSYEARIRELFGETVQLVGGAQ